MKVKCHLHSTEACTRNLELALANSIAKSQKDLFSLPDNRLRLIDVAKKYLPQFFNASMCYDSPIFIHRDGLYPYCRK